MLAMRFKLKLLHWPDIGYHALVIVWGAVDSGSLMRVFDELAVATESLPGCKILIDFENADIKFPPAAPRFLVDGLIPRRDTENKIALVSGCEKEEQSELILLRRYLAARGFEAAIFKHPKDATAWLSKPA
jgi:hypothetical protein